MQIVPLQAVPSQSVNVLLANQNCRLNVYTRGVDLFMDVLVNDELIIGGVICQNRNRIVRSAYLGFVGDFIFIDTQGSSDPVYTGLGDKFQLCYLEAADVAAGEV